MRMQKEEKIVVVLLLMALGSLTTAFWAFGPEESDARANSGLNSRAGSYPGLITVEGSITDVVNTRDGGNLILHLDSTALPVFIPASAGAKELAAQLRAGGKVRITGAVDEYQGEDELKVSLRADVQLLGA